MLMDPSLADKRSEPFANNIDPRCDYEDHEPASVSYPNRTNTNCI